MRLLRRARAGDPDTAGLPEGVGGDPASPGAGWLRELDQNRGGRWMAGVVVVVAVLIGLVAGGVLGSRGAALRPVSGDRTASRPPPLRDVRGELGDLAGLNPIYWLDDRGGAWRQRADGGRRERLGLLADLAVRRSPDLEGLDPLVIGGPATPGSGTVGPNGDRVYLALGDSAPAVERFADARPRRLIPDGWRAAGSWRLSRDGSTVAACGYTVDRSGSTIDQVRTWIADADGRAVATLPGCVYDVSADGSSALVSDPAAARAGGPLPEVQGTFAFQGKQQASRGVTRGLRLWRRAGGFQPVLGRAELLRVFRQVQPEVDPDGVAIVAGSLSPDGGRALVLAEDLLTVFEDGSQSSALLLVDLRSQRAQLLPATFPGLGTWVPTGGYLTFGPSETILLTRPGSSQPTVLDVIGPDDSGFQSLDVSPDGDWLLLAGERWTFIRIDDPAVRVSYRAPGRFAGWAPGTGR
jgi:hypothetical protein